MWPDSNGGPKEFNLPQILRVSQKFYKFTTKTILSAHSVRTFVR